MSFEIERKFLVRGNDWEKLATRRTSLRQAYLACNGKISIRIRIKDDRAATLTVKSRPADLRRLELEYDIPVLEAEALLKLRQGSIIEKIRHVIPCAAHGRVRKRRCRLKGGRERVSRLVPLASFGATRRENLVESAFSGVATSRRSLSPLLGI